MNILEEYAKGVRDFRGANLLYANLRGALGISFFQFNHYVAVKYGQRVSIGCKDMTIEEWIEKGEIIGKEEGASDFEIEMYMKFVKEG